MSFMLDKSNLVNKQCLRFNWKAERLKVPDLDHIYLTYIRFVRLAKLSAS